MVSAMTLRKLRVALRRIHLLASRRAVQMTLKAQEEMSALTPAADIDDVLDVLLALGEEDWSGRITSVATGEDMFVFHPWTSHGLLYVKVLLRRTCVVVSFHEEEG